MHPILATRGRTLLYLAGWVPILALLDYLMWASGGASWVQNTAVLGPACFLFAFACLSDRNIFVNVTGVQTCALPIWVPILALLDYLMWASGGASWVQNTAVLGPACFLFAFACLSPWPICRVRPL